MPNHSTFLKNRHGRFRDNDLLRELFEMTAGHCMAEGLVGGEGFATDASLIKADANKQRSADTSETVNWETMATTRRSVREYLDTLDDAAWDGASPVKPKSDPAAQWTGAHKGHAFFGYSTHYLIDLDHAVIEDVEPSRAIRQAEVGATRTMIERVQQHFGLYPERLAADTAYGSAENLAWLVHERGIEPHIPVFDHSGRRVDSFQRSEFRYDHDRDLYICPGGKEMHRHRRAYSAPRSVVDKDGFMRYRASQQDGQTCALKEQCCLGQPAKLHVRSTKALAIWREICPRPTPTSHPDVSGRKSKCCSLT